MKNSILIILIAFTFIANTSAQKNQLPNSNQLSIVLGVSQPLLLDGFNIAANYTTNCWVFEYSHGTNLHYQGPALKAPYKEELISLKSPFSTGAGVGPRLFANRIIGVDFRLEAKVHKYEAQLTEELEIEYHNFDLGGGLYTQIRPFGKKKGALKGIVIEPSIRYWANVSSTLEKDFTYVNGDQEPITHKPYPLNLFMNLSIGYSFGR